MFSDIQDGNEYKIRKWLVLKFHGSGHLPNHTQCGKPFFSNTRQNGELTETNTRQNEIELAMFGE